DNAFNVMDGGDVTDHIAKEIDKNTKNGLWEFYVNERAKGTIGDLEEYKEPCKRTCLNTFYKPYLDTQEAKNIYEVINREYSPIPIPARHDIDNPNELCRTEEFTVVRHSIGNDEEFVTVGPSKINTVERTPGSMSCIYHELFNKKHRGWEEQYGNLHLSSLAEKEELKGFLDIIPREEVPIEVESLFTKFPVVDWKTCVLTENFMYYQVFRGDGSSKNYKVLSEMLEDFDRQDVEELYRLVKKKYSASRLEGFDLMLWGDLYTLFKSDEEDEIWKNQHEYNLIS
ncbi:hypothetical protein Tco_0341129, partial [Tanacetum coccineum]